MEGIIFDIKRYAVHDGPGIRTTVFMKGCPLRCLWCHNPESWLAGPEPGWRQYRCVRCGYCAEVCPEHAITIAEDGPITDIAVCRRCGKCVDECIALSREIIGQTWTVPRLMKKLLADEIFYDQSGGGVTFSGGEPLLQADFLEEILQECKRQGIHTALDTSCYADPDVLMSVSRYVDLFLCDVKHIHSEISREFTGVDNTLILENIKRLADNDCKIIIRFPVIAGFNDDAENIRQTAEFMKTLRTVRQIDLLPYHPWGSGKASRLASGTKIQTFNEPTEEDMQSLATYFENCGYQVNIGG